ncbi:helix-turn-helix transcriptional regulator [Halohasta salina]|uniref:helix-turn-helix transcriptional regulator n=1 Tax=Halohasta salina TaxID=2961621 RepID=UPI0020A4F676|nr:helix-turn-helix domain-containing protein [Halohasta salina]
MRPVVLSVVLVVLLVAGVAPAGAVDGPRSGSLAADTSAALEEPAPQASLGGDRQLFQTDRELTPSTTFRIDLQADRSAEWTVTTEYELTTDSQQAAFDEIAADFESDGGTDGLDVSLYENLAARTSAETGRDMEIQDVERSSSRDGDVGRLVLSFRWTGFLEADGERLIFDDAIAAGDENAWLTTLSERQEVRITTPQGYAITSANVDFSDNTVVVTGPHTFADDEYIQITLEESAITGPSWELLAAAIVVGVAIIGGAFLLRRSEETADTQPPAVDTNGGVDTADSEVDDPEPADADEPSEAPAEDDRPEEDLSLLADDERVLRLLERNGGRMRQADIVESTGWSDAKVSQLLSSMADDDAITKLRIGRENLISLPDVDALDGSRDDEE